MLIARIDFEVDVLPEHCYDCKLHADSDGHCLIDGRTSDWRPFWCPIQIVRISETPSKPYLGDTLGGAEE